MKKVLSLVLVIAMILSSMSVAFAGTLTDVTGNDYEAAINTLVGLGVVKGYEDGTFRPERTVTRAEMAKMLVVVLGYGDLVAGSKSNFSDTQGHWADAYIALAAGKGIVVGTGAGKFTPDRQVSYDEAITMVIRALGYTDDCNELKGMSWPTNFKVKAAELELLDDVKLAAGGADRGGVAQLLYNALKAKLVSVTSEGDVKSLDKELLSRLAKEVTLTVSPDTIDEDSKAYKGNIVDLEPYMYQNLTVYENKNGDVVYVKGSNSLVLEGTLNNVADVTATKLVVEDADEDDYTFNVVTGSAFMVNGVVTDLDNLKYTKADVKVTVVLDAQDDDKLKDGYNVVGVVAEKATDEVLITKEYTKGRNRISGIALPVDSDNKVVLDKVTVTGAADSLEDIKEDSVVTVYAGLNASDALKEIKLVVSTDVVEGKISKTNYDKSVVTIAGKAYDASVFADKSTVAIAETGKLFLNANGEFLKFSTEEDSTVKNYAVVVSRTNGEYDEFLEANSKDAKVKLATAKDEEVIYALAEDAEVNNVVLKPAETAATVETIDLVTKLSANVVVEYSLDKNGKIDSIEEVVYKAGNTGKTINTDTKAFILASNAVIFDGYTADKYQVLTKDQLKDSITANVVYNKDGEIELLFVTAGAEAVKSGTFAIINNVEVAVNDSDETVYLITAYVNGNKVTYFTDKAYYKANTDAAALRTALRGGYKFNELSMSGNVVKGVTTEGAITAANIVSGNVKSVKVTNEVITLADGQVIALADDAVIYLQTGTAVVEAAEIADIDADDEATTSATPCSSTRPASPAVTTAA